jgi:D-3-phosphoglycerate dehydrogenase / 2-oxoglutarate reductase
MAPNTRRVFHVNDPPAPVFAEIIARRPDVQLNRLSNDSPDEVAEPILAPAHAYQIGATRDELATKYHGTAALLARTPNLLVISSNGAGYDTVDVPACTTAGVVVVNQTGGNKEGVAEHVLAMLLTLSKRIGEADRAMRRQKGVQRIAYKGHDVAGRTIGIIGIGNIGSRVADLCRALFQMRVLAYDPYLTADQIAARGAEKVELNDLFRASHYVSVNSP